MAPTTNEDMFLSIVSHELRTPLTSILGFSEMLLEKSIRNLQSGIPSSEMEKYIKHLQIVYDSSELLLSTVNNILDLVKANDNRISLVNADDDPEQTIESVVDSFAEISKKKGIGLTFGYHSLPKTIKIDKMRLKQILVNIIGNAIKFTNVGSVMVDAEIKNDSLIVLVRDTGIGMNQKTMDNLFKPFYQEDTTDTRKFCGLGLGLSIVKKLIDLMGGTITVKSEKLIGTEVVLSIPISLLTSCDFHSSNVLQISQEIRMNLYKKKIIAISSDAVEIEYLHSLFFNYGADLRTVETSANIISIAVVEGWVPDVVIMDFNEQLGSVEFIKLIKGEFRDIKFIVYSLEILENPKEIAKKMGFDGFVQKPCVSRDFFDAISPLF